MLSPEEEKAQIGSFKSASKFRKGLRIDLGGVAGAQRGSGPGSLRRNNGADPMGGAAEPPSPAKLLGGLFGPGVRISSWAG